MKESNLQIRSFVDDQLSTVRGNADNVCRKLCLFSLRIKQSVGDNNENNDDTCRLYRS